MEGHKIIKDHLDQLCKSMVLKSWTTHQNSHGLVCTIRFQDPSAILGQDQNKYQASGYTRKSTNKLLRNKTRADRFKEQYNLNKSDSFIESCEKSNVGNLMASETDPLTTNGDSHTETVLPHAITTDQSRLISPTVATAIREAVGQQPLDCVSHSIPTPEKNQFVLTPENKTYPEPPATPEKMNNAASHIPVCSEGTVNRQLQFQDSKELLCDICSALAPFDTHIYIVIYVILKYAELEFYHQIIIILHFVKDH